MKPASAVQPLNAQATLETRLPRSARLSTHTDAGAGQTDHGVENRAPVEIARSEMIGQLALGGLPQISEMLRARLVAEVYVVAEFGHSAPEKKPGRKGRR